MAAMKSNAKASAEFDKFLYFVRDSMSVQDDMRGSPWFQSQYSGGRVMVA
jgi:hypothetical protein